jgi:hypothetical protein
MKANPMKKKVPPRQSPHDEHFNPAVSMADLEQLLEENTSTKKAKAQPKIASTHGSEGVPRKRTELRKPIKRKVKVATEDDMRHVLNGIMKTHYKRLSGNTASPPTCAVEIAKKALEHDSPDAYLLRIALHGTNPWDGIAEALRQRAGFEPSRGGLA